MTNAKKAQSLAAKLAEITEAIGNVEKRGRNDFHRYDYATADDVYHAVRRALEGRSIAFLPSITALERMEVETKRGKSFKVTIRMSMDFVCGITGEIITREWFAESDDAGDKAINKAATAGVKYFLLKTFLISAGGAEADGAQTAPSDEKIDAFKKKIQQAKTKSEVREIWNQHDPLLKALPQSGVDSLKKYAAEAASTLKE